MATGLSDPNDRRSAISAPTWARRERVEQQFVDRVHAMADSHLTAGDGVERAAFELIDQLRDEGLHCEHALLAVKALVRRTVAQPHVLLREIVPRCITYYYIPKSRRREG